MLPTMTSGMRPMRRMQALGLLGLLTVLLLRQIADPDIWNYLVVGREMVRTLAVPAQEFYLFPVAGQPAMFSALGYSLLHYLAYVAVGYPGMAILNALLIGGALTVLAWAARPRDASPWEWPVLLCVLAGAYACLNFRTLYRPESTLFLVMALEILVLERWLDDGNSRRLLWLPLLAWGIAQLHTTAVLLVLVYGAYVCHWALATTWTRCSSTPRQAGLLVAIGVAMLLLPILNPNGVDQVLLLVRSPWTTNVIAEYVPVWSTIYRWHFVALAFVAAVAWLITPQRRVVDALLLVGFGGLAFRFHRNLGLFALVAVVPVMRSLSYHATIRAAAIGISARQWLRGGLMALGIGSMVAVTWRDGGWGVGIRPGIFPEKAVQLIPRTSAGPNIMNFYHLGGFLAWTLGPKYLVAVDGHFVQPSFALDYHEWIMRAFPDWDALLARFDVGVVVTPATLPFSGELIPLVERLAGDPRWRLISVEDAGMVFVAVSQAAGVSALDKRLVWRQVQREAASVIAWAPDHQGARAALALAERRLSTQ